MSEIKIEIRKTEPAQNPDTYARFFGYLKLKHQKKPRGFRGQSEQEVNQAIDLYIQHEQAEFEKKAATRAARRAERSANADIARKTLQIGDIFYSSWGYEQTNIDFYQVTAIIGKLAEIRPIAGHQVEGSGLSWCSARIAAIKDQFTGEPIKKLIQAYNGKPYFSLNSYSSAQPWDGKSLYYSWGH